MLLKLLQGLLLLLFLHVPGVPPHAPSSASNSASAQLEAELFFTPGQSNMVGHGPFADYTPPTLLNVFNYSNAGVWRVAAEPIDDATGQVDAVSRDPDAAVGPALAFAAAYQRAHPGARVGLIPCARDGSGMGHWQRTSYSRDTLYGSCLARVREAAAHGRIAGMILAQGESDAKTLARAQAWRPRFGSFVSAWREDLGNPNLPVVFAQIATTKRPELAPYWDFLKSEQAAVDIQGVSMIVTEDLPTQPDDHLTTASYLEVGERFAATMGPLVEADGAMIP